VSSPDGGGYDPGEASHAVLLELRRTVERHPAVLQAWGDPPAGFTRVQADLDPRVFDRDVEKGTLTIRWHSGSTPDDPPEFAFHYSDDSGFDCGWHSEPNPHVEGRAHYQERETAEDDYTYEPISFASDHPVGILWEVLERLHERLDT
jgi:hypothetical protein